jgi:hypothetical protein
MYMVPGYSNSGTAVQAAEKPPILDEIDGERPSGAKQAAEKG